MAHWLVPKTQVTRRPDFKLFKNTLKSPVFGKLLAKKIIAQENINK